MHWSSRSRARAAATLLRGLGGGIDAALGRQRFEGEASAAAEHFVDDRRIVAIGTGDGVSPADAAEKLGGAAVARLLLSGETTAVIDLTGLDYDADAAARVGAGGGASRLAVRRLSHQAEGQAEADPDDGDDRRRRRGRGGSLDSRAMRRWSTALR